MNPLLVKGLIASGCSVSIIGSVWGMYELFKPKTIAEKLEWQGITFPSVLDGQDMEKWKQLHESNNSANGDKVDTSSEEATGDNADAEKMRSACKKLMNKPLSEASEGDEKKVRQRCSNESSTTKTAA